MALYLLNASLWLLVANCVTLLMLFSYSHLIENKILFLGSLLKCAFTMPFSATLQKHPAQIGFNYTPIPIHTHKHAHTQSPCAAYKIAYSPAQTHTKQTHTLTTC